MSSRMKVLILICLELLIYITKNRQLGSLKGLKEISSLINLGNIQRGGLKTTDDCFKIACDVMSVILKSIDPIVVKDDSQDGDSDEENDDSEEGNGSGGSNTLTDEELQELSILILLVLQLQMKIFQ